ncbi:MAG TPA: hypothetical protein VGZ22_19670 [Isosphaeraceae bacterium]|jgi:hypothetical protein|nr:hypothetical protein [Isosphaeraceae bacterium]
MPHQPDPVYQHARREAIIILSVWALSTVYSCAYCYLFGYSRPGRVFGPADVQPFWGVPSWVFWGILAPWAACAVFTFWFAGFYMADDDLGKDHAAELESDIRERGAE